MNKPKKKNKTTKSKCGKPSLYTKAKGERICQAVAEGLPIEEIERREGVKFRTVYDWKQKHPYFRENFAHARECASHGLKFELLSCTEFNRRIRDNEDMPIEARLKANESIINITKWRLSKELAEEYGDKTQMVLEKANPADILPHHTDEQDAAFLAKLAAIQAKTPPPEDITTTEDE